MAGRGTVLVVDTDRAIVDFIIEVLTDEGYVASGMYDGAAATAAILANPPDLVLLDLLFDRVSGLEVARAARVRGNTTPIVIMTTSISQIETIEAAGAATCLLKPFSLDELLACVATHIQPTT
jgi:two-component system, OmpR family, response regulator MprA